MGIRRRLVLSFNRWLIRTGVVDHPWAGKPQQKQSLKATQRDSEESEPESPIWISDQSQGYNRREWH